MVVPERAEAQQIVEFGKLRYLRKALRVESSPHMVWHVSSLLAQFHA